MSSRLDLRGMLASARVYDLFQHAIGTIRAYERLAAAYLRTAPGDRVLDVGCGTALILPYLQDVEYYGFDASPAYIERARRLHPGRDFRCAGVHELQRLYGDLRFDKVIAVGVLHHIDDGAVRQMCGALTGMLKAAGEFVTFDLCRTAGQSMLGRLMTRLDRGEHVRRPEEYAALLKESFQVDVAVTERILYPYTHAILRARLPAAGA